MTIDSATGTPEPTTVDPPVVQLEPTNPNRRRWPGRLLLVVAAAWLLFTALQLVLSDWPLWTLVDLVPPLLFLLVPLVALLLAVPYPVVRLRMPLWGRAAVGGMAIVAVALGGGQAGVNWPALFGGTGPAPAGAIRVVSWDTLMWDQNKDPNHFYAYLAAQHADVYLLQEHVAGVTNHLVPIDGTTHLLAAFPGYHVATAGELLTLSRFPITAQHPLATTVTAPTDVTYTAWPDFWRYRILRTDIDVAGRSLSLYNLDLPDVFDLDLNPLGTRFYHTVTDLSASRETQFQALHADLARNANPAVISGVTNTLPDMGQRHWFDGLSDAARAGGPLYPVTLTFNGMSLWRMDWTFTTSTVRVHTYDLVDPQGISTHQLQSFVVSLAGAR
ncbi:MAG TPA: hypothetical protein VGD84_12505 [Pseudonocardiaceae bacterium]